VIRITVPGVPPSWNQIMRWPNVRQHSEAERWHQIVAVAARAAGIRQPRVGRARVTLRYRFPDRRRRDPDNYAGKFLLDGLQRAGIIEDDSFDHVQLVIERGEPVEGGAVEIEIEELGEGAA